MTTEQPEAEVVSVDAGGRRRVHFAGLSRDAHAFVLANFPRVHIEPGSNSEAKADVFVQYSNGDTRAYMGADSGGDDGWHDVDAAGNVTVQTGGGVEQEPSTPRKTASKRTSGSRPHFGEGE